MTVKRLITRCLLPSAVVALGLLPAACSCGGKNQWDGDLGTAGAGAPDKVTTTLSTGVDFVHGSGWAADVERAYFSTITAPFNLVRFNPADNTYSVYTHITGGASYALCITGGKVFVTRFGGADTNVCVFNTSSDPPSLVDAYNYTGSGASASIDTDGTYLFVGTITGNLLLIRIDGMVLLDTLALIPGTQIHSVKYNSNDGKVYATTTGLNAWQIPLGEGAFDDDAIVSYTVVISGNLTDDQACDATYFYVGIEGAVGTGGQIIRIPISTFDSQEILAIGPPGSVCQGLWLDTDGTHLWSAWGTDPGQLTRLKLSDGTTERVWLASGETNSNELVQYGDHDYLVACKMSPEKIINLTGLFTEPPMDKPSSGYDYSYWASLRPYDETTPGVSISDLKAYTDGANALGTGWSALGGIATDYAEPTGTEGVSGEVVSGSGVRVKP